MWPGNSKVFPVVVDLPDARWLGVDASLSIEDNGVRAPGRLPEFVGYLDIFLRYSISVVVVWLLRMTQVSSSRIKISGDDVPSNTDHDQVSNSPFLDDSCIRTPTGPW